MKQYLPNESGCGNLDVGFNWLRLKRPPLDTGTHLFMFLALVAGLPSAVGCTGTVAGDTTGMEAGGNDSPGGSGGETGSTDPGTKAPPPVSACKGEPSVGAGPWRRLTAAQYSNTVRDLFGTAPDVASFLADSRTGQFTTNAGLPVEELDVDGYATVADATAKKLVQNVQAVVNCNTATTGEDQCAAQFIKDLGGRAYRRPLTAEEETRLKALYAVGKAESYATGIRVVVEALLQSPHFLYMVEPSSDSSKKLRSLTGYEIATRLSYLLTGSMPDAELFMAARSGTLSTVAGIKASAERLMTLPKFVAQVGNFYTELLSVDTVTQNQIVTKPAAKNFDAALRATMVDEPRRFVDYVMTKGSGSIEELLTANYVLPTGGLVRTYGNPKIDADGRAVMTDGSRSGLLTLASTQSVHPRIPTPSAAVNRGYMVRHEFLCETIPPPPGNVDFTPPPNAAELSAQQLLREHQTNPTCKGCHSLMDSIGFGFENYDLLGGYRTKDDRGNALDSSGEVTGLQGDGKFSNVREMTQKLAASPQVRACMATQWFRYALAREPADQDACTAQLLTEALSKGKGVLKDGLLALVVSDSFRFKGEQ